MRARARARSTGLTHPRACASLISVLLYTVFRSYVFYTRMNMRHGRSSTLVPSFVFALPILLSSMAHLQAYLERIRDEAHRTKHLGDELQSQSYFRVLQAMGLGSTALMLMALFTQMVFAWSRTLGERSAFVGLAFSIVVAELMTVLWFSVCGADWTALGVPFFSSNDAELRDEQQDEDSTGATVMGVVPDRADSSKAPAFAIRMRLRRRWELLWNVLGADVAVVLVGVFVSGWISPDSAYPGFLIAMLDTVVYLFL